MKDEGKIHVFAVANRSLNDTSANKLDISGILSQAGYKGTFVGNVGTVSTLTGIYQSSALVSPPMPTIISNAFDYISLFPSVTNPDPRSDSILSSIWSLNINTDIHSTTYIHSTAVLNAINHNSGSIGINLGGFDYHNVNRISQDSADKLAGELLGRIIKTAISKNQKTFIYLTTDGGNASPESDMPGAPWVADNMNTAIQVFIVVDPSNSYNYGNYFIGAFTSNQVVDTNLLAGSDTEKAAAIVACNYLSFNGQINLCSTLTQNKLSNQEIETAITVKPLVY